MKKVTLSLILAMAGLCALGFTACKEPDNTPSLTNAVDVVFPEIDGITFVTDDLYQGQMEKGDQLSFTLDLSAWNGSKDFTLLANGEAITKDENGIYSLTADEAITISFADVTVTFNETEGVEYVSEYGETVTVPFASDISFSLNVSPYYTEDSATVRAGTRITTPDENGVYTVRVTSDIAVSVLDVVPMQPSCTSGGTSSEDPFWIYTPADWLFIAEQVNSGNVNYVNGYYQLGADLDFKGETIPVIGDATLVGADGVQTYFGGYFNGDGYTIKNFNIQQNGTPYVGLFGYVVADLEDANLGFIIDLHVSDFSISAVMDRADEDMLAAGGIVGYGIGANVINCSVDNARIEITGNDNYPAFVGGAVGVAQTAFIDFGSYQSRVSSQFAYISVTNTDVIGNSGIIPAAGGVIGYTYVPDYLSTASLINCYADNVMVYGAVHTGGVVGQLGAYSSVFNCYATGSVTAATTIRDIVNMKDYCTAYAGGVVAYAENETAIVNNFSTVSLDAQAALGNKYQITNGVLAKADSANTHTNDSITAYTRNNYYAEYGVEGNLDLTDPETLLEKMNWYDFDWTYAEGATYPSFNFESRYEDGFSTKAVFVGVTVNGRKDYSVNITEYAPMSFAIISGEVELAEYMVGDNGEISFGFFFDEACTQRVPYSYLLTALEQTLYVGFITYDAVAGEYEMLVSKGDTASLKLNNDGSYEYEDGEITTGGIYRYNGEYIVFENARFARYANGGVIYDLYQLDFYSFTATIDKNGDLNIFDGTYFTEEQPLKAISSFGIEAEYYNSTAADKPVYSFHKDWTVTAGGVTYTYTENDTSFILKKANGDVITLSKTDLVALDSFKGEWTVSAAENLSVSFDGKGNWTMESFGYDRSESTPIKETYAFTSGTYTVENGVATLFADSTQMYSASIDSDGFLCLENNIAIMSLSRSSGYAGEWLAISGNGNALLRLNGITVDGSGMGEIEYWDGNIYQLFYAMEYGRITLYNGAIVFGYLNYDLKTHTLVAYLYDSNQSIIDEANAYVFYNYDTFKGEWVSAHETLGEIEFNGFGAYEVGLIGMEGKLTINGETVDYKLDSNTMQGSFTYDGITYTIHYNPVTGKLTIENNGASTSFERKDVFAAKEIVDADGNLLVFDGKGNLADGGKLTVIPKTGANVEYGYKLDGNIVNVTKDGENFATITVVNNVYVWAAGTDTVKLYEMNSFVGSWAVSGSYSLITLEPMNTIGEMKGTYNGRAITVVYNAETGICTYGNNYLIPLEGGDFAISASETLGSSYQTCTKADDLFGTTWTQKSITTTTFTFDGVGKSENTYGSARRVYGNSATIYTYEYLEEYNVYRMWATVNGSTSIFLVEFCDVNTKSAYVNTEKTMAFTLSSIDELFMVEAVEEATGYIYTFDGRYTFSTANGGQPGTVTVTDKNGDYVTEYQYLLTLRQSALGRIEMTLTAKDGTEYHAVFSMMSMPYSITLTPADEA